MTASPKPRPPSLPRAMMFEGLGLCIWAGLVWKCPDKNDFYISGAEPMGYRARQHLTQAYWVARPTHYARRVDSFVAAGQVEFTQGGTPIPRVFHKEGSKA